MNEDELERELSAANPVDREAVASQMPPGGVEAMLREITAGGPVSLRQRITDLFGDLTAPAWGRAGFVGVLAVMAFAVVAINPGSSGGEQAGNESSPAGILEVSGLECEASGPTLSAAREAYDRQCDQPRTDCEPIGGRWLCSSRRIGDPSQETPSRPTTTTMVAVDADGSNPSQPPVTEPMPPDETETPGTTDGDRTAVGDPAPGSDGMPGNGVDCISIEAEQLSLVGAWSRQDDDSAGGGAFIAWNGLAFEKNNRGPVDVITKSINITNPGSYRFVWAMRQPDSVAGDKANDSWVNFPDAGRFGPVDGGSFGGFVKVFGNARDRFGWVAEADHDDRKSDVAIDFERAGTYTMQLAGRSHGHQIDRIVIFRDSVARQDAIDGTCAGRADSPDPAPAPVVKGSFDEAKDLISLHFDHAPDRDDAHATVAAKVITDSYGITPWVIGGAYGINRNSYKPSSEAVMDATWGEDWVNADDDWEGALKATADRWQQTLEGGGDIWVAEGGQSDMTAAVVRELAGRLPSLDTAERIHVVQHSDWNEDKTTPSDLRHVRNTTDYIRIEDGNSPNSTADLNRRSSDWERRARDSRWGSAWGAAFRYLDPDTRLDFSDTVEVLHILGIPKAEIASTGDFADRFFG